MRWFGLLPLIFIAMTTPALSETMIRVHWPDIWTLPPAPQSSGFIEGWKWSDDSALLRQLSRDGDPLAQSHECDHLKDDDAKDRCFDDMRRQGNPEVGLLEVFRAAKGFIEGTTDTDTLRSALRGAEGLNFYTTLPIALLDVQGGKLLRHQGTEFDLTPEIGKGDPVLDEVACHQSITPSTIIVEWIEACRLREGQGDGDAAWRLGLIYQQRLDDFRQGLFAKWKDGRTFIAPDLDVAIRHYRLGAAAGHAGAQARLAYLAAIGRGMPKDLSAALSYARASAEQGHPEGLAVLGLLTLKGWGLDAASDNAVPLIRAAAERGSRVGQFTLATLLFRGKVLPRDFAEGLVWLRFTQLDSRDDMPIDEYGDLMIEAWPRTMAIGNMLRMSHDADMESMSRAALLRRDLARSGKWTFLSEDSF